MHLYHVTIYMYNIIYNVLFICLVKEVKECLLKYAVSLGDLFFCLFVLCKFFFFFLELHLQHMEVPRLGVRSELQLPAYTTATAMQDPICICDLHCSSLQHRILNPLSEARDRPCIFMDSSQVC